MKAAQKTKKHAESQLTHAETVRLLGDAMRDPACRGTLRLERAMAQSTQEMLGRWSVMTPEGRLHRVAVVRVVDGEVRDFDECYRDEADAVAVWEHIREEYIAVRTKPLADEAID